MILRTNSECDEVEVFFLVVIQKMTTISSTKGHENLKICVRD
jgi:hypothetical protein